jgi:hypothetical protein
MASSGKSIAYLRDKGNKGIGDKGASNPLFTFSQKYDKYHEKYKKFCENRSIFHARAV